LADIGSYDEAGGKAISAAIEAAGALPGDGWMQRIADGEPFGPLEELFAAVRATSYARDESGGQEAGYGLETEAAGLDGLLIEAALAAQAALAALRKPLMQLGLRLEAILADPPDWLDGQGRARIEGARQSLGWRVDTVAAWESLLARLGGPADPAYVDWLAVERSDGREFDIGLHRRWVDPMQPFATTVLNGAHGVMMTSATLRGGMGGDGADWDSAIARSGAPHLDLAPEVAAFESPFDYAAQAEVLIVTDVPKGDIPALANAYGRLIEASGGGALGLFTAIRRLRAVHGRIADRMARLGLPLYAQHVDPIDTGTLVDIFRDDPRASLLGTANKVVTSTQRFEFIQTDAVSERVLARTVVVSLRDGDAPISDEQTLTFDSTSQLLDERKRSVFLTVLAGAHDPHRRYDLVMRDAITKVEVLRLPIKVDLAFGSDF
jgi:ATP-dependent DNA helicase DinG